MSDFFLSQLFGFIGLIFDSGAAQCKERNRMAAAMGVGAIFIAAHFALLGQVTAAAMFATAATRHFITIYFRSKFLYGVFVIMALVFVAYTYQGVLKLAEWACQYFNGVGIVLSVTKVDAATTDSRGFGLAGSQYYYF